MYFPVQLDILGSFNCVVPWDYTASTHLHIHAGNIYSLPLTKQDQNFFRDVAQLVARTAGGREAAGSSPVIPTRLQLFYEKTDRSNNFITVLPRSVSKNCS